NLSDGAHSPVVIEGAGEVPTVATRLGIANPKGDDVDDKVGGGLDGFRPPDLSRERKQGSNHRTPHAAGASTQEQTVRVADRVRNLLQDRILPKSESQPDSS